jgi:hypothetical protein
LLMQGGAKMFAPRPFEAAPELIGEPGLLILDGQQRLTSLYQAFAGKGAHRFFLNLRELIDGMDVDEAVEVYTPKQAAKWATIEAQAADLMLPLARTRSFTYSRDDALDVREAAGEDVKKLKVQLNEVGERHVRMVDMYQFPMTTLSDSTPVEAVCNIFETLNKTGVKLSVFELLTARAFAHDVRLRGMWDKALAERPILEEFGIDPYYILQAIAVRHMRSPKRGAVLNLKIPQITDNWDAAIAGMADSLTMLREECGVLVAKWVPYYTMLITMAAVWPDVTEATGPAQGGARDKIRRWFWCSVFSQTYENAPNSRSEADVPNLRDWLEGAPDPEVVAGFTFDSEIWRSVTVRQRALYKATIALTMSGNPRDFHKGRQLTPAIIVGEEVDDHHVFPQQYLKDNGLGDAVDSVLNHTLIDKITNIRIGKKAPSTYLDEMINGKDGHDGQGRAKVDTILSSHHLPDADDGPLFQDRFEDFLTWRLHALKKRLDGVVV